MALIGGDIELEMLERMIPLIAPRELAPYCDSYLQDQLTLLLVRQHGDSETGDSGEEQADILLQACDTDIEGVGGCGIVRLSLSRTTDDETYEYLDAIQSEILSFSGNVKNAQKSGFQGMWQQERIVDARTITVEWECRRMYGQGTVKFLSKQGCLMGGNLPWFLQNDGSMLIEHGLKRLVDTIQSNLGWDNDVLLGRPNRSDRHQLKRLVVIVRMMI